MATISEHFRLQHDQQKEQKQANRNDWDDDDDDDDKSFAGSTEEDSNYAGESTSQNEPNAVEELEQIAGKETHRMNMCKVLLVMSLLLTGTGVCVGMHTFLRNEQDNEFQNKYYLHSNTIRDITKVRVENMVQGLVDFADEMTAYARGSNSSYPFVTMPFFEVKASHVRRKAGVELISVHPLVQPVDRDAWERYSVDHTYWIPQGRDIAAGKGGKAPSEYQAETITPYIAEFDQNSGTVIPAAPREAFAPVWQFSPPNPIHTNFDSMKDPELVSVFQAMTKLQAPTFGAITQIRGLTGVRSEEEHKAYHAEFIKLDDDNDEAEEENESDTYDHPHAMLLAPLYDNLRSSMESKQVAGFLAAVVPFDRFMNGILPNEVPGIYVVIHNSCGQAFSYLHTGSSAEYLGKGDLHETPFDKYKVTVRFGSSTDDLSDTKADGYCEYEMNLYPSNQFQDDIHDSLPIISTLLAASVFLFIIAAFFVYDNFVNQRNTKVMSAAAKTSRIVMSLFPSNVRAQLLGKPEKDTPESAPDKNDKGGRMVRNMLNEAFTGYSKDPNCEDQDSKPIAELFPETTVMFGDISGFTAWSSIREPAQVFILLENLYREFDHIAKRRKVFKVETIGDCYVAVCGLPEPRPDHAVVMARFSRDCMESMREIVKRLELQLGPDTAELSMRIGLHSGPVTAGVLRGERARFQLFGDTVNTAARMESTGHRDRVHLSTETADQLIAHGKNNWLVKRSDPVVAKGKGLMNTYWLSTPGKFEGGHSSLDSGSSHGYMISDDEFEGELQVDERKMVLLSSPKTGGLIRWNTEVLARLVKKIVASRKGSSTRMQGRSPIIRSDKRPLDEVVEIIALPQSPTNEDTDSNKVELEEDIMVQLRDLITSIAALYHDNPFHSFEHASHVTMSVQKMLSRIVAPSDIDRNVDAKNRELVLHDHTYGITSDPLTQFACVFSALIHDIDHHGVPNTQLVKEETHKAKYYNGKSVAEQNSVDLAWSLLMQDDYDDLRRVICVNEAELKRFRQLVVNAVMATDIMDKDLKVLRNARWEKAFTEGGQVEDVIVSRNRKATIVIEHLIQASDVVHTMQHWHIDRKWNERLYNEMVKAYQDGRSDKHPSEFWYEGELGFFDFYIIPLAKKLKNCGVFGVSSDECLNYAMKNRQEWEAKGKEIVAELKNKGTSNLTEVPLIKST